MPQKQAVQGGEIARIKIKRIKFSTAFKDREFSNFAGFQY
jgi:hypothetical protein